VVGVSLGLVLGIGLFCIWWSFWPRQQPSGPSRKSGLVSRLSDELAQAGFNAVTPRSLLGACVMASATVFVVFAATAKVVPIALCFGLMAGYAPIMLVRMRARKRRSVMRELWPDVVDNIGSAVRAGLALPEALSQLTLRGPVELRPAFANFAEDYRATGRFQECLDRLKERLSDPTADRLIESLRIAREVGGSDLGRLLRTLSAFLREDARTRAELETRQGWTVSAARLAVAAPWLVLAMLSTRPDSLQAYSRPAGVLVLAIGASLSFVAYSLMVRVGRLPEEGRVLR
jgi:tight adherence protein B